MEPEAPAPPPRRSSRKLIVLGMGLAAFALGLWTASWDAAPFDDAALRHSSLEVPELLELEAWRVKAQNLASGASQDELRALGEELRGIVRSGQEALAGQCDGPGWRRWREESFRARIELRAALQHGAAFEHGLRALEVERWRLERDRKLGRDDPELLAGSLILIATELAADATAPGVPSGRLREAEAQLASLGASERWRDRAVCKVYEDLARAVSTEANIALVASQSGPIASACGALPLLHGVVAKPWETRRTYAEVVDAWRARDPAVPLSEDEAVIALRERLGERQGGGLAAPFNVVGITVLRRALRGLEQTSYLFQELIPDLLMALRLALRLELHAREAGAVASRLEDLDLADFGGLVPESRVTGRPFALLEERAVGAPSDSGRIELKLPVR